MHSLLRIAAHQQRGETNPGHDDRIDRPKAKNLGAENLASDLVQQRTIPPDRRESAATARAVFAAHLVRITARRLWAISSRRRHRARGTRPPYLRVMCTAVLFLCTSSGTASGPPRTLGGLRRANRGASVKRLLARELARSSIHSRTPTRSHRGCSGPCIRPQTSRAGELRDPDPPGAYLRRLPVPTRA